MGLTRRASSGSEAGSVNRRALGIAEPTVDLVAGTDQHWVPQFYLRQFAIPRTKGEGGTPQVEGLSATIGRGKGPARLGLPCEQVAGPH